MRQTTYRANDVEHGGLDVSATVLRSISGRQTKNIGQITYTLQTYNKTIKKRLDW